MRRTIIIVALCAVSCFEDAGGSPDDASGTETTTSTSSTTDGDGGTSEADDTSTGTGTGSQSDETSTASGSGSEACTVDSCPEGEFCVDGVCGPEPPADMIVIPEGTFYRGCGETDPNCEDDEYPADPDLFVSTFAIDRTEVAAADYDACVTEGGCTPASTEWERCNSGRAGYEQYPINCVTWSQADAYCAWAGRRLPTEAEWEKAARGTDGRLYPWGDAIPDCTLCVKVDTGYGCGTDETWPVGSKPAGASPYGVLNMAGNVREWVSDWYAAELEVDVPDPQGPEAGDAHVLRGASFMSGHNASFRASFRGGPAADGSAQPWGFRCAAG